LIGFILIALVAVAVLFLVVGAPWRIGRLLRRSKRERGLQAISMGMVAVAAGDTVEARKQAHKARALAPNQPMTTLLAAQSAQLNGDPDAAKEFFTQLAADPDAAFLGLRGLWMQAMRDGRVRDALSHAEQANALQPSSGWVLDSLFELQTRLGQWEAASTTLDAMSRYKVHPAPDLKRNRALVDIERSRALLAANENAPALKAAQAAYKAMPGFVPAAAQLAAAQIAVSRRGKAEKTIQDTWKESPHPLLAKVYRGVVEQVSADKQLNLARGLADLKPGDMESRILVAEFAVAAQKWSEAQKALAPLDRDDAPARVCRLMAEIEMASNGDAASARDWIARSASAPPDPAWVCAETGAVQAEWSAVCTESERFGTLEWRVPNYISPDQPILIGTGGGNAADTDAKTDGSAALAVVDMVAEPVAEGEKLQRAEA
jgi:HemY protein